MMEGKSDVVDINMDIDNMPDCRLKYKIIFVFNIKLELRLS